MTSMTLTPRDDGRDEVPTSDRSICRLGLAIVFVTFGIFGGWAALAPLDNAVYGSGQVTVQSYRKTVQHLEGGIIKELLVHDGDLVHKGDPLIVLDQSQISADYESTLSQVIAARTKEARLRAERDDLPTIPTITFAGPETERAREALEGETHVFNARRNARLGAISVKKEHINQLSLQIIGLESMVKTKLGLERSYSDENGDLKELLAQGFVDKQRLLDQQRKLDMLKSEVADHQSNILSKRSEINETQLEIVQLTKDFNSEVVKDLADVQSEVFGLQEKAKALKDTLGRIVIRAPEEGMVLDMKVHTIGGVVSPATPLMDIVPESAKLVVELHVSTNDIDRIALDKTADIRFTAFNSATMPVIGGTVTRISADRLTDDHTGDAYYLVRVALTADGVKKLADRKLLPGMPAEVLINAGDRTMLQYLLKPARNFLAKSMIEE